MLGKMTIAALVILVFGCVSVYAGMSKATLFQINFIELRWLVGIGVACVALGIFGLLVTGSTAIVAAMVATKGAKND